MRTHADAIQSAMKYNVVSCSSEAIMKMPLDQYAMIDVLTGLERDDGHSLVRYKAMGYDMRVALRICKELGMAILVSGAYLGSDARTADEQRFLEEVLRCKYNGVNQSATGAVNGMGASFNYFNRLNDWHYAATHTEILEPADGAAYCTMVYGDKTSAAVAYGGKDYRTMTMGFPFECIEKSAQRKAIMQGILKFLLQ